MNTLKSIISLPERQLSFKFRKFFIYKLFFTALLKRGNKIKAQQKYAKIIYFLKKMQKKKSPQQLIFLAVTALKPPLRASK